MILILAFNGNFLRTPQARRDQAQGLPVNTHSKRLQLDVRCEFQSMQSRNESIRRSRKLTSQETNTKSPQPVQDR